MRLRDLEPTGGRNEPSVEERAVALETAVVQEGHAAAQLEKLRAAFEAAGDEVNLLWLRHASEGIDPKDLKRMATASGKSVEDFYAAATRRKRAVLKLLGQERGVDFDEKEPPYMSARRPEAVWQRLVDEAGEEAIEEAAALSVAQAERDLAAAGFDVAAERADAVARIDTLASKRRA